MTRPPGQASKKPARPAASSGRAEPATVEAAAPAATSGVAARARLRRALHPRATRAQLAAALLLALVGFGAAVQARSTRTAGLSGLRQTDLVRILDDTSQRTARLQAEQAELEQSRARIGAGASDRDAALRDARKRAEVLGILAGTLPAQGPGIELAIPDPQSRVDAATVLDTVEELRDAGAEAMTIGGVRLVASSAFVDAGAGRLRIDGVVLAPPYLLRAIGDPAALASALKIPGGVLETLLQEGSTAILTDRQSMTLPVRTSAAATPSPTSLPS